MKSNEFLSQEQLDENLRKWFKEKWVRFGPDGKIRGDCARGDDSEGKPKCLPQSKAHSLGKKGRASAAARKRREDPNPERRGPAKNVATKKKTKEDVTETTITKLPKVLYHGGDEIITQFRVPSYGAYFSPHPEEAEVYGPKLTKAKVLAKKIYLLDYKNDVDDRIVDALFDRDYNKVSKYIKLLQKHGYDAMQSVTDSEMVVVFPGTPIEVIGEHTVVEGDLDEACWKGYHKEGNKKMFGKTYPNCVKNTNEEQELEEKWSQKYKDSINCSDPKGFSQKAHCAGRKKNENIQEEHKCPQCGGEMVSEELMNEKKDACYYKVKSRYKVWPSAYASGALVKCRKKGAKNWGTGGKKNEDINEGASTESITNAILGRIERTMPEVFSRYGDEHVYQVVSDIASFYEGAEELGSSDISAMVHSVMKHLNDKQLNELSPETLASYKKKAGAQASELDKAAFGGASDAKEKLAKAHQRFKGITKATMKQFDQPKKKVDEFVQGYNMNQAGIRKYKPKHVPNQDEIQKMSGIMEGLSKK